MNRGAKLMCFMAAAGIASGWGCEPPPEAEKKKDSKPVAKSTPVSPQFAPKAAPKSTPSATPTPSPTVVVKAAPPAPPKRAEFTEVAFPDGRTLTAGTLFLDRREMLAMFPSANADYFLDADAKEQLLAVVAYTNDGKWNGSGIAYQADHTSPRFVAQFKAAVRDGSIWGWSADNKLNYWAQYRNGRREGFAVLIKNREPALVQEWRDNQLKKQYLIELVDNKEFKAREVKPSDGAVDKTMQDLTAELKLTEEKLLEEEKAIRRRFVDFNNTRLHFVEYDRITRGVAASTPGKMEEARKRNEFWDRYRRLYERWQLNFWKTPL